MNDHLKSDSLRIKEKAVELGFSACGIAPVRALDEERERLNQWLTAGMNGSMGYMANHFEKRLDPGKLESGALSVVSVLINYFPNQQQTDPVAPVISKYAYGNDYHFVVKEKLNNLLIFIQSEIAPCRGRAFVDSAPVLERAWAKNAGLGWIGKNSLLISKKFGSFVFIGELIINLELFCDTPFAGDYCGNCTRCIDACPTQAIVAPRVIDARKCISYQTIEHKSEIPESVVDNLQNRVFGCDICQDVCPWNNKVTPSQSADFKPVEELLAMTRKEWHNLAKATYLKTFRHTAFERAGFEQLRRNINYLEQQF